MLYDRIKYELYNDGFTIEVEEPPNWNDDNKSLQRNIEYHGIAVNLSDSLKFVKIGRDYLNDILNNKGINAKVRCTKWRRNPQTDVYEIDYQGWIDFTTAIISQEYFEVKLNADPLIALFKSKLDSKIEIDTDKTLTGKTLPNLNTRTLYIEGRDILLTNKLTYDDSRFPITEKHSPGIWVSALPLNEIGELDQGIKYVTSQIDNLPREFNNTGFESENFIKFNDSGQKLNYKFSMSIKQTFYAVMAGGADTVGYGIRIAVYKGANTNNFIRSIPLWDFSGNEWELPDLLDKQFNLDLEVDLEESMSIQYYLITGKNGYIMHFNPHVCSGDSPTLTPPYDLSCTPQVTGDGSPAFYEVSVTIREDSERSPSTAPAVMIYDYAKRINDIVLEKGFKSDLLQDMDDLGSSVLTHGMWLRGMKKGVDGFKPLTTSLKEFLKGINSYYPIGVDISNNKMIIEKRSHFYQNYVSIELGEVSDLEISFNNNTLYSTIDVGYNKEIAYEENNGLDEPNRLTQYNTIIDVTDKKLDLTSRLRTDSYGLEQVRRESPEVGLGVTGFDDDSKFDEHIWLVDIIEKASQSNLEVAKWDKRFAKEPTGIYSPETIFNLWFSPINVLLRYGEWLKPSLLKYLNSKIAFNSSEGNSSLTTQQIGGNEYRQNDGIIVKDFERSIHNGFKASFTAPITWEQLNGSELNRKNIYGQISFERYGLKYKGYILKVETKNGIGTFEVLLSTSVNAVIN